MEISNGRHITAKLFLVVSKEKKNDIVILFFLNLAILKIRKNVTLLYPQHYSLM